MSNDNLSKLIKSTSDISFGSLVKEGEERLVRVKKLESRIRELFEELDKEEKIIF
jgi:hypothetical protein